MLITSAVILSQTQMTEGTGTLMYGIYGHALLEDAHLIEKLWYFRRERIPEKVMYPKEVGSQGDFITTKKVTSITKTKIFTEVDKKTHGLVRFPHVIHSKGSPEATIYPRGFSIKLYTDEGDWGGNSIPTFFVRDTTKFSDFPDANKRFSVTKLQDDNRIFDYLLITPEVV